MAVPRLAILHAAARRYGIGPLALHLLRDGANIVYGYEDAGQERILRLTKTTASERDRIEGEIAWLDYLAQMGVRVPTVIRSVAGKLVEVVTGTHVEPESQARPPGADPGGQTYMAVVFARLLGKHPEGAQVTDAVLTQWGKTLGQIHRAGRAYRAPRPALRHPQWHMLDAFDLLARVPTAEKDVRAQCTGMLDYMHELPRDETGYGLIHADPEPWNFFLCDGELTFIDFEESCYCWYAFDLAVSILYAGIASTMGEAAPENGREEERGKDKDEDAVSAFACRAWPLLYAGYASEHQLPAFWLDQMPMFLRLRVLQDYAFHMSHWDLDNLVDWQTDVLRWQRRIILEQEPVLEIEWRL